MVGGSCKIFTIVIWNHFSNTCTTLIHFVLLRAWKSLPFNILWLYRFRWIKIRFGLWISSWTWFKRLTIAISNRLLNTLIYTLTRIDTVFWWCSFDMMLLMNGGRRCWICEFNVLLWFHTRVTWLWNRWACWFKSSDLTFFKLTFYCLKSTSCFLFNI